MAFQNSILRCDLVKPDLRHLNLKSDLNLSLFENTAPGLAHDTDLRMTGFYWTSPLFQGHSLAQLVQYR